MQPSAGASVGSYETAGSHASKSNQRHLSSLNDLGLQHSIHTTATSTASVDHSLSPGNRRPSSVADFHGPKQYNHSKSTDITSLISPPTRKRRCKKLERLAILNAKAAIGNLDESEHTGPSITTASVGASSSIDNSSVSTRNQRQRHTNLHSSGSVGGSLGSSDHGRRSHHNQQQHSISPSSRTLRTPRSSGELPISHSNPNSEYKGILPALAPRARKDGMLHLVSPQRSKRNRKMSQQRKSQVHGSLAKLLLDDKDERVLREGDTIQFSGEGRVRKDADGTHRLVFHLVSEVLTDRGDDDCGGDGADDETG
uniref:Uncharacterized protein n=1 Tax=Craspedostauros australis TaxID=1486917 RepID=A0A7R9WTQ7_9STRA